jgi:CBS domain-containing protein
MKIVRDILAAKRGGLESIAPDGTVLDALRVMADREIGAVLVRDAAGHVQGILSERDYARKVVLLGKASKDTPAREIMTPAVRMFSVRPTTSLEECLALMGTRQIRHLPVFDDGQLLGLVSIGDVVSALLSDRQDLIDQLSAYIAGKA